MSYDKGREKLQAQTLDIYINVCIVNVQPDCTAESGRNVCLKWREQKKNLCLFIANDSYRVMGFKY